MGRVITMNVINLAEYREARAKRRAATTAVDFMAIPMTFMAAYLTACAAVISSIQPDAR